MIPKIIHYCWFGKKEKPPLAKKCISSWKKLLPDYSIVEWNEKNFPINIYPYALYCLKEKKYAFLSDYVRLIVIYEEGGIYFDTDVELKKRPDALLRNEAFFCFENDSYVATGLGFGAEKNHITIKKMIEMYSALVPDQSGDFPLYTCPRLNTEALVLLGLKRNGQMQMVCGAIILPSDYLNPYDDPTGTLRLTNNTISIHWYGKSWMKKSRILRSKIMKPFHRWFGVDAFQRFRK